MFFNSPSVIKRQRLSYLHSCQFTQIFKTIQQNKIMANAYNNKIVDSKTSYNEDSAIATTTTTTAAITGTIQANKVIPKHSIQYEEVKYSIMGTTYYYQVPVYHSAMNPYQPIPPSVSNYIPSSSSSWLPFDSSFSTAAKDYNNDKNNINNSLPYTPLFGYPNPAYPMTYINSYPSTLNNNNNNIYSAPNLSLGYPNATTNNFQPIYSRHFSSTSSNQKQATVEIIAKEDIYNNQKTYHSNKKYIRRTEEEEENAIKAKNERLAKVAHRKELRVKLRDYLNELPQLQIPSHYQVACIDSIQTANEALLKMTRNETLFGVDMEWKPCFVKGEKENKTGVIQICGENQILLIQTSQMKTLPNELVHFLESKAIFKVGVNIVGDGKKLIRDFGIYTNGLLDLGFLSQDIGNPLKKEFTGKSLRAMVGLYIGKNLPKGKVQLSDWNRKVLSPTQFKYASTDVYATYSLYHAIIKSSNNNRRSLPPRVRNLMEEHKNLKNEQDNVNTCVL
ncbi:ribonuclease H-like domain-containing protein [Cunninghamella echinulata]|nr:ribonuclease H-like domain-containing protein [Cunninghamella echinulata]